MELDTITLYHYTKAENLPDIIAKGRMKLMEAGRSNDPFEMNPTFSLPCEGASLFLERNLLYMKNSWREFMEDRSVPSVCFSASISSLLMWSHYAQAHTGVCLAFRFPLIKATQYPELLLVDLGDGAYAQLSPIIYTSERIKASDHLRQNADNSISYDLMGLLAKLVCSKPKEWEYEKEFRMFLPCDKSRTYSYPAMFTSQLLSALTGVVLGNNCRFTLREVETMLASSKSYANDWDNMSVVRAKLHSEENLVKSDDACTFSDMNETEYMHYIHNRLKLTSNGELGSALISGSL